LVVVMFSAARIRAGWRKFSELSQVLRERVLLLKLKGRLYLV